MTSSGPPPPALLLGIPVHPLSVSELIALLVRWGHGDRLRQVLYVNVHGMNLAHDDPAFREQLQRADLVFCDGFGVKWGARLAGVEVPHRLTPPDWIARFAAATSDARHSVFALGDEAGVAAAFQARLCREHPGYLDAGSAHGFFALDGADSDAMVEHINASGATHLLLGLGMPRQEKWLAANAARLTVRTAITVGALFRWHAGIEQRAPAWMTDHGLEWLARLARHPIRHFQRYVVGNPRFLLRVLRSRLS